MEKNEKIIFDLGDLKLEYEYEVTYLQNISNLEYNSEIFNRLGITHIEEYCSNYYNYPAKEVPNKKDMPECYYGDYDALTRLVNALQLECAEYRKDKTQLPKKDDKIIFCLPNKQLEYLVVRDHLIYMDGYNNEIFKLLHLDAYEFCSKAYGYKAGYGDFPTCKKEDYAALKRVITALQNECDKVNKNYTQDSSHDGFKFKVGDVVKILPKKENEFYPNQYTESMQKMAGGIHKITARYTYHTYFNYYTLERDGRSWRWDENALELVSSKDDYIKKEKTVLPPKFQIGDRVKILPRRGNIDDYPGAYTNEKQSCVGQECIIKDIIKTGSVYKTRKYYEEPYLYRVYENCWTWSSASLELLPELTSSAHTDFSDTTDYTGLFINAAHRVITSEINKELLNGITTAPSTKSFDYRSTEIKININKHKKHF